MNKKTVFFIIFIMLLVLSSILLITVYQVKKTGKKDIVNYREKQISTIKQSLKNYVDLAYEVVDTNIKNATSFDGIVTLYGENLKNIVQMTISLLEYENKNQSLDEVKNIIRSLKYDDGKYVWIINSKKQFPEMIVYPPNKNLEGKILKGHNYDYVDGKNENFFVKAQEITEKNNFGFINSIWPKKSLDEKKIDSPAISYVQKYEPLNWIVGTGMYFDEAIQNAMKISLNDLKNMRYDNRVGYFWINDISKPYPKMIMHPIIPSLDGKMLDSLKYNSVKDTKENLFVAFRNVCEKNGKGFVEYVWPKPTTTGLKENVPKISYVKLYKPLNWIIGTGVYVDDIDKVVNKKDREIKQQITKTIYTISIAAIISSILFIVVFLISLKKSEKEK